LSFIDAIHFNKIEKSIGSVTLIFNLKKSIPSEPIDFDLKQANQHY